jgi:hypothetical protein
MLVSRLYDCSDQREAVPFENGGVRYSLRRHFLSTGLADWCRRRHRHFLYPGALAKRIYAIRYDRTLEEDVQDVFITSLKARGNVLLITNERGERFVLDLSTRKVTRETDRKP